MTINRFEDLEIWKEARELCKCIFQLTQQKPFADDYRLKDQIKASSGSIMDNIAEGFDRDGKKEFIQFLSISKGSCSETRSQLFRAFDFNYIDQVSLDKLLEQTSQIKGKIAALMNYLSKSEIKGIKYK